MFVFVFVIKKDSPLGQVVSLSAVVAGMEKLGMMSFPPGMFDNIPEALKHLKCHRHLTSTVANARASQQPGTAGAATRIPSRDGLRSNS